jgi:hypothetical protein
MQLALTYCHFLEVAAAQEVGKLLLPSTVFYSYCYSMASKKTCFASCVSHLDTIVAKIMEPVMCKYSFWVHMLIFGRPVLGRLYLLFARLTKLQNTNSKYSAGCPITFGSIS